LRAANIVLTLLAGLVIGVCAVYVPSRFSPDAPDSLGLSGRGEPIPSPEAPAPIEDPVLSLPEPLETDPVKNQDGRREKDRNKQGKPREDREKTKDKAEQPVKDEEEAPDGSGSGGGRGGAGGGSAGGGGGPGDGGGDDYGGSAGGGGGPGGGGGGP
jgi:hypothetical protein